ncbi:MAG TPA: carbohydrate ABC transporter permease [Spirochaetia bacterium]
MKAKRVIGPLLRALALALFLVFAIFPLYWIIITSLKDVKEIYTFPLLYFPAHPMFKSYEKLFGFNDFGVYFRNSLVVTLLGSVGSLIFAVFSGFALSRNRRHLYTRRVLLLLYFSQMIPSFLLMTPLYTMVARAGGGDSLLVLGIIYIATTLAFSAIMSKSFFDRIPVSIEEAALVDGCSTTQTLLRITLPVMVPGLIAIFSFSFVNIWNELFMAVLFLSTPGKTTVPVALNSFISKAGISWDTMSAGIVMALLPTMLIFAFGQRYIVSGLTEGGVKG